MEKDFRPMLAAAVKEAAGLPWPLVATPKLDGIRCLVRGGQALTRSLKLVPNQWVDRIQSLGIPQPRCQRPAAGGRGTVIGRLGPEFRVAGGPGVSGSWWSTAGIAVAGSSGLNGWPLR